MKKEYKTVFSPADILLPPYENGDKRWEQYAVIACDQFTSEIGYWNEAERIVSGELSALGFILPEAYLETDREEEQKNIVRENMKNLVEKLALSENCLIYVERSLPEGGVRRGLVGKLDLMEYDFDPDSVSAVRATEQTVVSRIPPRVAVRREATVELPHVMVFADDKKEKLFKKVAALKDKMIPVYDFSLMLGGGNIKGYKIEGELLCEVMALVEAYESSAEDDMIYAMGDGNHSLASAKAHFEAIRAELGEAAMSHPARYALVEMVDLYDSSIEFEPIYRILLGSGAEGFEAYVESRKAECDLKQKVVMVKGEIRKEIEIPALHSLTVGSLQILIDDYLKENSETVCDYIHGVESLVSLCKGKESVGFLFEGVAKNELFSYVSAKGTLPRKTFSMGSAYGKRYYIEARKIVK